MAGSDLVLVDHVDRLQFMVFISEFLRNGAVLLVHDFPYEATEEEFERTLAPLGINRILKDVQNAIGTDLAVFQKTESPRSFPGSSLSGS